MSDFELSADMFNNVGEVHLFTSDNDFDFSLDSARIIQEKIDTLVVHNNPGMGHHTCDLGGAMESEEFNELLEVVK